MTRRRHPPNGAIIRSMASQSLSWKLAISEWIDNAFDAAKNKDVSLSRIEILIGAKHVQVKDNSKGHDRLESMVIPGAHDQHDTTQIGQFGIGAKDASLWIGGESCVVVIDSTCKGVRRTLTCDYADYAIDWELADPVEEPARPGDVGTTIVVAPRKREPPHGQAWAKLIEDIGYIYSAAIKKGARIEITGPGKNASPVEVQRWKPPEFDGEIVDREIVVNGKTARVYCGVVRPGEANRRSGLTYLSAWRVIVPESSLGCGLHNITRVCGFVELGKGWSLSKNKNEILGDARALFDAVEQACGPVLRRADTVGSALTSRAFESSVSALVNRNINNAKAKRASGTKKGAANPTGTGGRHRDALSKQPGETMPSGGSPPVSVVHDHIGDDKGYGEIKGHLIVLNLDNASIKAAHDTQNVLATAIAACTLIGAHHCLSAPIGREGGRQLSLRAPAEPGAFSQAVGDLLSDVSIDGQKATAIKAVA